MNIFQLAAGIDAAYRAYCEGTICNPFEVEHTWCQDLVIAMVCESKGEPNAIKKTIDDAVNSWKTDYSTMRDLITAINYLAWWTYESEDYKSFSPQFSDLYHDTLDIIYDSLTEDESIKLWRILD